MPVLVDPIHRYSYVPFAVKDWCHMAVDGTFEELHAFAASLGIPRSRFQGDHYDLTTWIRERAVALGAEEVSTRELLLRHGRPARRPSPRPPRLERAGDGIRTRDLPLTRRLLWPAELLRRETGSVGVKEGASATE